MTRMKLKNATPPEVNQLGKVGAREGFLLALVCRLSLIFSFLADDFLPVHMYSVLKKKLSMLIVLV